MRRRSRRAGASERATQGRGATIFTRLVSGCWALFRGAIALAVVVVVALGVFLYFRLDEEAKLLSERALTRYCAPFQARVGSAEFTPGRGVTMRDVEIVERLDRRPPRGVLQIEELRVEGSFDLGSLMRGKPIVRRVLVKTPRLAATRREDGSWNVADLRPPSGGGPKPAIDIRDATVLLADERGGPTIALHHLDAAVGPSEGDPGRMAVRLSARDTLARSIEANGTASADGAAVDFSYKVEGLAISEELLTALRGLGLLAVPAPPVRGELSLSGAAVRGAGEALRWNAAFRVAAGQYRIAGLRRSVRDVDLQGVIDNAGVRLDRGEAHWGDAAVTLAARSVGFSANSAFALRARVADYDLGTTPVEALPEEARRLWERFRPAGRADVAIDLAYDGQTLRPRATITGRDASFEDAERFPYRLTHATGEVRVNGGVSDAPPEAARPAGLSLDLDLRGDADGAPIQIVGAFHSIAMCQPPGGPRPKMPLGWIEVSGVGVPISDRLVAAIPEPGAKDFIRALHPSGRIDVRWRAERNDPADPKSLFALDLRLVDCRMLYERFPYPLSGVTGWVQQRGDAWRFYELRSRDTQGRTLVEGLGSLQPRDGTCGFELKLTGAATPLDQTLFDALQPDAQQAWAFLRPDGRIDFDATVTRGCGEPAPRVRLKLRPHERELTVSPPLSEGGSRYRLDRVDGDFEWADNRMTMRRARAEHGRTVFTTDGAWDALGGGAWRLELLGLSADRLDFGRDFLLAAPAGLRAAIEGLQPRGGFDLFDSRLEVTQKVGPAGPVEARWKANLNCHQAAITAGVPLEGISGVVALGGTSDGAKGVVAGELDLDSVFWNDLQLSQVRGPVWADATDCFLGEGVAAQYPAGEKRPITATAYDGQVRVNSWVRHSGQPRYGLAVAMAGVNVTRLSSEWLRRAEAVDGVLDGQLEFQGSGASIYGLTGRGDLSIRDADLYELPLFLSLLKYLRNRTPDNTAFNRLEAKFALEGNAIQFENLDLLGDAVSLYGKGTATLDRQVDLTFASIVGRNEFAVPVLKSFVSSASEQLLRLRVVGSADAPEVRREVLPAVANVLEQLQAEFGGRVPTSASRPASAARR